MAAILILTSKIIIRSLQFFMWSYPWVWRWPDKIFTDNENGRFLAIFFLGGRIYFSESPWNLVYRPISFQGLRVYYHCPFSYETENEATAAILVYQIILLNRSYFQLNALKPGIYSFSRSIGIVRFHVRSKPRLERPSWFYHCSSIIIVLERVVSDLWTFWVTASAHGCLRARTVF